MMLFFSLLEVLLLSFLSGVIWYEMGWVIGVVVLGGCVVFGKLFFGFRWRAMIFVLVGMICLAGYARGAWVGAEFERVRSMLDSVAGVSVFGEVSKDPLVADWGVTLEVTAERVVVHGAVLDVGDVMFRVKVPRFPEYFRGDRVAVRGRVVFDERYRSFLLEPVSGGVELRAADGGFFSFVLEFRRFFVVRMQRLFPGDTGGLFVGILAGGSGGMGREHVEDVRATGLTHIIAVSGYNVALVLQCLAVVLSFVPRRWKLLPTTLFLVIFLIFVGMSASAVRAALMGFFTVFALASGRKRELFLALLWTAVLMVLWNPTVLLHDRGFQLSFLATIGVAFLGPLLQETCVSIFRLTNNTSVAILSLFTSTLAVYILTLPVLFSFQKLSLIGLVTNVIFVPTVPFMMMAASGIFVLSFLGVWIASLFGIFVTLLVEQGFSLLHIFANLPGAVIEVPSMSAEVVLGYYGLLALFFYRYAASSKPSPSSIAFNTSATTSGVGRPLI